jgi:adenylate kinase
MTQSTAERYRYCIFTGPPGTGKSTIACRLAQRGIAYLSVTSMIRNAIDRDTLGGRQAKKILDLAQMIPEDLVIEIIRENLRSGECRNGFILDGFPNTITQAEKLDAMLVQEDKQIDHVFNFVVSNDRIIIDRLSKSLIHPASGRIYDSVGHPPKIEGKDDITGEDLENEQSIGTVKHRIRAYRMFYSTLVDYYRQRSILSDIDASNSIETICENLSKYLPEREPWYTSLRSLLQVGYGSLALRSISPVLMDGFYIIRRALSLLTYKVL